MAHQPTITSVEMRGINRSAILEIIRRESPIARTTIAQRLGVSLPTVMRIVDELVEEGFVRSQGKTEWSGGRRRPLLEFNADGYIVLGVDMGGTEKLYGAISEIGGHIINEVDIDRRGASGEDCYKLLTDLIDTLLASPGLKGRRVRGIGVGAPGITLHREGIISWAPSLNWRDYPLKARLAAQFGLPVRWRRSAHLVGGGVEEHVAKHQAVILAQVGKAVILYAGLAKDSVVMQ